MKTLCTEIKVILLFQAIATAPASAQSGAQDVEVTGDGDCLRSPSRHVVLAQEKPIYKWTDEDGNVHYSDNVPPEYAYSHNPALQDNHGVSKRLKRELDLALFVTQAGDMELYAQRLRKRLTCLEAAADRTKDDESLLEEIRDTEETIEWFDKYRDEYRQKQLERHQDAPDIEETIDWFEKYRDENRQKQLERHQDAPDISEPWPS